MCSSPMPPQVHPRVMAVNVVYQIRRGAGRDTAIDKRPVAGQACSERTSPPRVWTALTH
jgi:hypothetical protein